MRNLRLALGLSYATATRRQCHCNVIGATRRLLNSYVAGSVKGVGMTMFPDSYPGSRFEIRSHSTGCERRLPFFFDGLQAHVQYRVVVVPSASAIPF